MNQLFCCVLVDHWIGEVYVKHDFWMQSIAYKSLSEITYYKKAFLKSVYLEILMCISLGMCVEKFNLTYFA